MLSTSNTIVPTTMMRCLFILVAAAFPLSCAQDFDPNAFGGGEPKFCPPYRCPKDHEPVPKWPLKYSSTGCSGMGGMNMFSPGSTNKDATEPCCDRRHACYQTCGSLKKYCDQQFLKCTEETCAALATPDEKSQCEKGASIHKLMVQMDNQCTRFDQEQYVACECVEKSKVADKRERIIRNFYKKYSPENAEKAKSLLQKVKNSSQMSGLLLKLVTKYPEAIKKVKDPQQEMMEKMMKDAENKRNDESDKASDETVEESGAEDLGVDEL